jgi:hypothetical protein
MHKAHFSRNISNTDKIYRNVPFRYSFKILLGTKIVDKIVSDWAWTFIWKK